MGDCFERPPECKSVLTRSYKYRQLTVDADNGFCEGSGWWWQSHHILCDHALKGRVIITNKDYVEDCLWITDWDLNNPDNLLGLPTNRQHKAMGGKLPLNTCSHQVDHNTIDGYTDECKQYLKKKIWDTLNDKRKDHEINAEDIANELKDATSHFKEKLEIRGARKDGTKYCWENRHDPKMKKKWFYPFSMADEPNERSPGVSYTELTDTFKKIETSLG